MSRTVGVLGVVWGIVGVFALLLVAIYRLAGRAMEAWDHGFTAGQWVIAVVMVVFMAYAEGYRGFQRSFSPRTAARLRYLRDSPDPLRSMFAPIFALGMFHATRRTRITIWTLYTGILILILLLRFVEQPWRGIIDAGVVVGLAWGTASLAACTVRALTRAEFDVSPKVPG